MRHITLLLALLSVLALAAVPATAATKVFLLGGQSNMEGFMTGLPSTSPYNSPLPDVQFWNLSGTGWVDLDVGFGNTTGDIGPEVGFGHALNQIFPDDDIYLVKHGVGSTSLSTDWNPDGSGPQYNTFKSRVNAALSNLSGQSPEIAGMIWMQGEQDANNVAWGDAYEANLTNFISTVRSDFSAYTPSTMPFSIGRITDLSIYNFPKSDVVRAAQVTVANADVNNTWIDTDDIEIGVQAAHYGANGQLVLGTRFANAVTGTANPIPEPSFEPDPLPDPVPVPTGSMGASFTAGTGTYGANANTIGWRFKAGQDLTVTRLGCLNGVPTTGDTQAGVAHAVGIYDEETEALLGSAVVVNGAAGSSDQWMWTDIATPISLTAGKIYRVATHANGDQWAFNTDGHAVGPGILIGTDLAPGVDPSVDPGSRVAAYELGNVLQYPADTSIWTIEGIGNGFYGANFKYEDAANPTALGAHGTGTHADDVTAPTIPANNLIVQGGATLTNSFTGGADETAWGLTIEDMNSGVMTDSIADSTTILGWDGVESNYGWAVYELDTTTNTEGYDISEILSYAGWTDRRIYQAVEIKYSLVGDTITEGEELGRTLGSFSYIPTDDITDYDYSTLSITNDEDPLLLSGVSAIEVKYIDNLFDGANGKIGLGNYTAYKQFAVIGTPTETTVRTPGDANEDGYVDVTDLGVLATNYGASGVFEWGDGDFTGDGLVNVSDLGILATWYGTEPGALAVPEPSMLAGWLGLCLAGVLAAARRKRRDT